MSPEQNKALVRRFVEEAQVKGDLAAIDTYLAEDFVDWSGLTQPPGREGVRSFFAMLQAGLPDLQVVIHDQVADGDLVVTRKTLQGTHRGELLGIPPTGNPIAVNVIDILRIADGRIREHWACLDRLGLMQQLGVISAAA